MKTTNELRNLYVELYTQVYGINPVLWGEWSDKDYQDEIDILYDYIERRNMAVLGGW